MPNVLVRNLPDDVHKELLRRAELSDQSLQQYLTAELTRLASTPTLDEVLARIGQREGGRVGFVEASDDLAAARSRH